MRRCVWSRNLKNEEALARVGPQRYRGEKKCHSVIIAGSYGGKKINQSWLWLNSVRLATEESHNRSYVQELWQYFSLCPEEPQTVTTFAGQETDSRERNAIVAAPWLYDLRT